LAKCFDTTAIYDLDTGALQGFSNNYWAVLARAEMSRKKLGLLHNTAILERCIEAIEGYFHRNKTRFFDDSRRFHGRYDIYSFDVVLLCQPLCGLFNQHLMRDIVEKHHAAAAVLAREDGALLGYGRSTSILSICLCMEWFATSVANQWSTNIQREIEIVGNAFKHGIEKFESGILNVHKTSGFDSYRGPQVLLQYSIDALAKMAYAAAMMASYVISSRDALVAVDPPHETYELWPHCDKWISLDGETAGIWVFRNSWLSFQLPCLKYFKSDYAAWFRTGSLQLDIPVESAIVCGAPLLVYGAREGVSTYNPPIRFVKSAHSLSLFYVGFEDQAHRENYEGTRVVQWHVLDNVITVEETWEFRKLPDAIAFVIPQGDGEMSIKWLGGTECSYHVLDTMGVPTWRSPWGSFKRLHEFNIQPAFRISFRVAIELL
jgi:hypothetical protein